MGFQDSAQLVNLVLVVVILALLLAGNFKLFDMANELETLRAEVAENKEVTQSAVTLLQGLKQKLDDAIASGNPAALHELSNELGASTDALAAAVAANTPAEQPPTE